MIIILWVYLAGIPIALFIGFRRLGRTIMADPKRRGTDDVAGYGLLAFIAAGLWPIAVIVDCGTRVGEKAGTKQRDVERQLKEAQEKLDEIARREGLAA